MTSNSLLVSTLLISIQIPAPVHQLTVNSTQIPAPVHQLTFNSTQIPAPVHQLTVNHLPVSGQGAVASIDAVLRLQSGYELPACCALRSFCAFMHKAVQQTCRLIVHA